MQFKNYFKKRKQQSKIQYFDYRRHREEIHVNALVANSRFRGKRHDIVEVK